MAAATSIEPMVYITFPYKIAPIDDFLVIIAIVTLTGAHTGSSNSVGNDTADENKGSDHKVLTCLQEGKLGIINLHLL